jgi:antitoxin component YwqK of YwqJK toxin-antitoxin module
MTKQRLNRYTFLSLLFFSCIHFPLIAKEPKAVQKMIYGSKGELVQRQTMVRDAKGALWSHGPYEKFSEDGHIIAKGELAKGNRIGSWEEETQDYRWTGTYIQGKKHGLWEKWSLDKKVLLEQVEYEADQIHGKRSLYQNGDNLILEESYFEGVLHGPMISYYQNKEGSMQAKASTKESLRETGLYLNGKKSGSWKGFYPDGATLYAGSFQQNIPIGQWSYYTATQDLLTEFDMQQGTGLYRVYELSSDQELQLVCQQEWRDGVLDGKSIHYYPDNKQVREEAFYRKGAREGDYRYWDKQGNLLTTGTYRNHEPIGIWEEFDPQGFYLAKQTSYILQPLHEFYSDRSHEELVKTEKYYTPDGVCQCQVVTYTHQERSEMQIYYPDGQIHQEGQLVQGEKHGLWREFNPDGLLLISQNWVLGRKHGESKRWHLNPHEKNSREAYSNGKSPTAFEEEATLAEEGSFQNDHRQGLWKMWHPSGELKAQGYWESGECHGLYTEFYDQKSNAQPVEKKKKGKLQNSLEGNNRSVEGQMVLGKPEGNWTYWYPDGAIKKRANYLQGKEHGVQEDFFPKNDHTNALLAQKQTFLHGKREGPWLKYASPKVLEIRGNFHQNKLQGLYEEFYPTGTRKARLYYENGKKEGRAQYYNSNGKLAAMRQYLNDQLHGEFIEYHDNGKVAVAGTYICGLPDRQWYWYGPNGKEILATTTFVQGCGTMYQYYKNSTQKRSQASLAYGLEDGEKTLWDRNGVLNGVEHYRLGVAYGSSEEFYSSGTIKQTKQMVNQLPHGIVKSFYGNTNPRYEKHMNHGVEEGPFFQWYENGQIAAEGEYCKGEKHGTWRYYNRYGELEGTEIYDCGIQLDITLDNTD